jgi:hypothetical protein
MKFFFIIILFFLSNLISANELENNQVEVIILHENKSLDQMVLENLNNDNENEVNIKEVVENPTSDDVIKNEVEVEQIEIVNDGYIYKNQIKDLNKYFDNLQNITSKTLQQQIIEVVENIQFDLEIEQDRDILFLIVNYFKSIGQINKSYELIEKYELSNDKNFNFYTSIKLNYLLSTFQLNEACSFKEEINFNIILDFFFLEKLDIFCSLLNNNESEARLLNSILIESEDNIDNYYQHLFSLITNAPDQLLLDTEIKNLEINTELIFLYSAMTRIAELPFSHEFYELDKKNLSIPIILNQASPIDLRIKAANESFLENLITVDSLAALYMSADFNSDQFKNSKNTIDSFANNKELSMAFLFQLVNIQIFPNDRLNALIQFWDFSKQNNLEEIAYKLSNNMLSSIEVTSENVIFGPKIALAYIFNSNFEQALAWIELYENAKQKDANSIYTRVLLDLYSSNDLNSFINSLNLTLNNYIDDTNNEIEELFFVLKNVINLEIKTNTNINLDKIFDERSMPSIFVFNEINNSINNNNDEKFLIYSLISLNNKNWSDIHPEHLKLILKGYLIYNDGVLFRNLILEIFKNYKFII